MDEARPGKGEWVLTEEAFGKLLALFDLDPEIAAIEYEKMRVRLRKYFECNRVSDPDKFVDETFDRAARKIEEGIQVQNIASYLMGIARFVLKEYYASRESRMEKVEGDVRGDSEKIKIEVEEDEDETDLRMDCLDRCSVSLTPEERQQIIDYYFGEKREKINNRVRMAKEAGVPLGTLRVRMHRLRDRLEKCILSCVEEKQKRMK